MNEFDILIGVNMKDAESSMKESIDSISKSYPLKIQAVLSNESGFIKEVNELKKLLGNISKIDINLGLKEELGKVMSEAKKIKSELEQGMKGAKKGAETFNDELEEGNRLLREQIKTMKDKTKIEKVTVGTPNDKTVITKKNGEEVSRENIVEHERQRTEQKKLQKMIQDQVEKNEEKILKLEKEGIAHNRSIGKLKTLNNQLNNMELNDLNKIEKKLKDISNQYKVINNQITNKKFDKDKDKAISGLQRKSNKQVKADLMKDDSTLLNFEKSLESIKNANTSDSLSKAIERANVAFDELLAKQNDYLTRAKQSDKVEKIEYDNDKDILSEEKRKLLLEEQKEIKEKLSKLHGVDKVDAEAELRDIQRLLDSDKERVQIKQNLNQLQERLKNNQSKMSDGEQQDIQKEIELLKRKLSEQKAIENSLKAEERNRESLRRRIASDTYRAGRGLDNSPIERAEIARQSEILRQQADSLVNKTGDDFDKEAKKIRNGLNRLNMDAEKFRHKIRDSANSSMGQLANAMRKVPIWMSTVGLFYESINQVKMGFQSILDYDSAMTNLMKVTEATTVELEKFKEVSHQIGMELGVTATDVVKATTEFQKIGYSLQESALLGKSSLLYANVGDMSVEEAQRNMVSAVKGFGIEVDKSGDSVTKIVDIFNEVSNNYAITASGIGEALRRSSAVLHEAGNSIEQSVALVTAANTTIQNPDRVGTSLKTISMRLRGISEEGQEITTLVPEIEGSLESINKKLGLMGEERLTLMKDEDTFLSTFEMMDRISKQWDKLTDMERANLVELIGGKEQGSIVSAMINNWADATNSYETALNSAGSAQREHNKFMDSFEYKIGRLKTAIEGFWQALINDDAVKEVIDSLTDLVNLMTKLASSEMYGGIAMIVQFFGAIALFSSRHLRTMVLGAGSLVKSFGAMGNALKVVGRAVPIFATWMAVLWGVAKAGEAVYLWLSKDSRARKERISHLTDEINKLEELKGSIEDLDAQYGSEGSFGSGIERFAELRNKNRSMEEEIEFDDMSKKIEETAPQFISHYDAMGNAVFKTTEEMREMNRELEKTLLLQNKELLKNEIGETDYSSLQESVDKAKDIYKQQLDNQRAIESFDMAKEWIEKELASLEVGSNEYEKKVSEFTKKVKDAITEGGTIEVDEKYGLLTSQITNALSFEGLDAGLKNIEKVKKSLSVANGELVEELRSAKDSIAIHADEFKKQLGEAFTYAISDLKISTNSNEYLLADRLRTYMLENLEQFNVEEVQKLLEDKNIKNMIQTAIEEIGKADLSVDDLFIMDAKTGEETAKAIQKIIDVIPNEKGEAQALINILEDLRIQHLKTANSIESTNVRPFNFDAEITPVVDEYYNKISELDSAYRQLAEGQQLSNSQVWDIIKNYSGAKKHLIEHKGQITLTKEAIMELARAQDEGTRKQLQQAKKSAEIARERAKANIIAITGEIKAEQLLSQTRGKAQSMINKTRADYNREIKLNQGDNDYVAELIRQRDLLKSSYDEYADYGEQLDAIDKILRSINSGANLGSIGGGSSSSKGGGSSSDAIYIADLYSQRLEEINQLLERQRLIRARYAKGQAQYNETINQEVSLLTRRKNLIDGEIASLEKQIKTKKIAQTGLIQVGGSDNSTARKKNAELQQEIDEAKSRLEDLRTESMSVFNEISEVRYSYIESVLEGYARQREQWTDDIAYTGYTMSLYSQKTDQYRKAMEEQKSYMETQLKIHEKELAYLEEQKKTHKYLNAFQKEELNALIRERRESIYSLKEELSAFNLLLLEQKQSKFSSGREQWSDDIAYTEYMMSLYDSMSEGFRKFATEKEGYIKLQLELHQQELSMLEAEKKANKSLTDAQRESLNALIREQREAIYQMSSTLIGIQTEIANSKLEEALYYMSTESEAYAKKIEEINDSIKYDVEDDEYYKEIGYLQQILALRKGEVADIQNNIAKLKGMYEENKGNVEMAKRIAEEIDTWEDKLISSQNAIKDLSLNMRNIYERLADEYVDIYKEQLELMRKADEEYYKNKLEEEQKAHDSRMSQIDKELRALEKAYEVQNKAIDRESATKSYNDKMNELEKEALELKKQIDILSLDDSYEAKKKKAELVKKLTEIEMEMSEHQYERSIDLRKENLEDDLEAERERLENKKDSLTREYEAWVEMMEKQAEARDKYWEEELSNERKFAELKRLVLEGNFNELGEMMDDWASEVSENMELVGRNITLNLIDKINQAKKAFQELKNIGGIGDAISDSGRKNLDGSNPNPNPTDGSIGRDGGITPVTPTPQPTPTPTTPKGKLTTGTFEQKSHADNVANSMKNDYKAEKTYVIQDGSKWRAIGEFLTTERANKVLEEMKKLKKIQLGYISSFRSGGYTGDWSGDDGKLAVLHKKELILNNKQTEDILNASKVIEKLKAFIPKLNMANIPNGINNSKTESSNIENNENINITIHNLNGTRRDVDRVTGQMIDELKRTKGGRY